ncbi:MAG: hypothetical protein S0880_07435, partial [Actinomycetota bacterium]|nr:hypothetical protein [Actinomycetota bacterium]
CVAYATLDETQEDVVAEVDVTDLQLTVTLASGRLYKVEAIVHVLAVSGASTAQLEINDGVDRVQIGRAVLDSTSHFETIPMFYPVTGDGASHDLRVRAAGTGNGIDVVGGAEFPCVLAVHDVGPAF